MFKSSCSDPTGKSGFSDQPQANRRGQQRGSPRQQQAHKHGSHTHVLSKSPAAQLPSTSATSHHVSCSICSAGILPTSNMNEVYYCAPCEFYLCHKCYSIEEAHFSEPQVVVRTHLSPLDAPTGPSSTGEDPQSLLESSSASSTVGPDGSTKYQPLVRTRPRGDAHVLGAVPSGMLLEVVCSHTDAEGQTYVRQSFGAWLKIHEVVVISPTGAALDSVVAQYLQYDAHGGADLVPQEVLNQAIDDTFDVLASDPSFGIVMASFVLLSIQLNTSNPDATLPMLVKSALLATAAFKESLKQLHAIIRRKSFVSECALLPTIMGRASAVHWSLQQRPDLIQYKADFFCPKTISLMNSGLQVLAQAITSLDICRTVSPLEHGEEMKQLWRAVGAENVTTETAQINAGSAIVAAAFTLMSVLVPDGNINLPAVGASVAAARVSPCAQAAFAPLLLDGIHSAVSAATRGGGAPPAGRHQLERRSAAAATPEDRKTSVHHHCRPSHTATLAELHTEGRLVELQQGLLDCDTTEFSIRILRTTKCDEEIGAAVELLGHLVQGNLSASNHLRQVVVPNLIKLFGQQRSAALSNQIMGALCHYCAVGGDKDAESESTSLLQKQKEESGEKDDVQNRTPQHGAANSLHPPPPIEADCGSRALSRNLVSWYLCPKSGPQALCPHCKDHCTAGEEWRPLAESHVTQQWAYVECTCPFCTCGSQTTHPGLLPPPSSSSTRRSPSKGAVPSLTTAATPLAAPRLPIPPPVRCLARHSTAVMVLAKVRAFRSECANAAAHLACVLGLFQDMDLALEIYWSVAPLDRDRLYTEFPDALIFLSRVPNLDNRIFAALDKSAGSACQQYLCTVRQDLMLAPLNSPLSGGGFKVVDSPDSTGQAPSSEGGLTPSPGLAHPSGHRASSTSAGLSLGGEDGGTNIAEATLRANRHSFGALAGISSRGTSADELDGVDSGSPTATSLFPLPAA